MYIIATEDAAISNVTKRHCRIGKITPKPSRHWAFHVPPMKADPYPLPKIDRMPAPYWSGGYVPVTSSGDVPLVPSHGVCL